MELGNFIIQEQHSVRVTGIQIGQWFVARYFGGEPYVVLQCKRVTSYGTEIGVVIPEEIVGRRFTPTPSGSSYVLDLDYKLEQLQVLQRRSIKEYDEHHRFMLQRSVPFNTKV
jgi:hypothetical protein